MEEFGDLRRVMRRSSRMNHTNNNNNTINWVNTSSVVLTIRNEMVGIFSFNWAFSILFYYYFEILRFFFYLNNMIFHQFF